MNAFLFDRNPDFRIIIFVTCPAGIFIRRIVHLNAVACRKLILMQRWQPLGKYFFIHALQCLRKRPLAGENCPCERRNRAHHKSLRNLLGRIVNVGNQVFKTLIAHLRVNVDAKHSAHMLSSSRGVMLLPECGNLLPCIFIAEHPGCRQNGKSLLVCNSVIHRITTFQ